MTAWLLAWFSGRAPRGRVRQALTRLCRSPLQPEVGELLELVGGEFGAPGLGVAQKPPELDCVPLLVDHDRFYVAPGEVTEPVPALYCVRAVTPGSQRGLHDLDLLSEALAPSRRYEDAETALLAADEIHAELGDEAHRAKAGARTGPAARPGRRRGQRSPSRPLGAAPPAAVAEPVGA